MGVHRDLPAVPHEVEPVNGSQQLEQADVVFFFVC
jgi:hypothetical protein